MAHGQQKIQSQQKNAKKQAGQKKKQGHDQKAAAKAALIYTCTVCRVRADVAFLWAVLFL
jgi:ribosomal protein L44E